MSFFLKRRLLCLAVAILTIPAGIAWRMVHLGLSPFFFKYGGSLLWACMVYFLVAAAVPAWRASRVAWVACLLTAAVEFFKLVHTPALDAFRLTLAGGLLLGRIYSSWDILAYWIAILFAFILDSNASHDNKT